MKKKRSSKPHPGREHGFYRRLSAAFIVCAVLSLLLSSHPALARPSNNASKLILSAKNELDPAKRVAIYIRIGDDEDYSALAEIERMLPTEKEPSTILAALYAYLRPKYKESESINKIFQKYDGYIRIYPDDLFRLLMDDSHYCSNFLKDAEIVTNEMISDEKLWETIKDEKSKEIIRAMAVVVMGNRPNQDLNQIMDAQDTVILHSGFTTIQAMAALALSVKNEKRFSKYHNVTLNADLDIEKHQIQCEEIISSSDQSSEFLFEVLEYALANYIEWKQLDASDLYHYTNKLSLDTLTYLDSCSGILGWPDANKYLSKHLTYLTSEQRKILLFQLLVVFSGIDESITVIDKLKNEYGDLYLDKIKQIAIDTNSDMAKFYIREALQSYHSHLLKIAANKKDINKIATIIKELNSADVFAIRVVDHFGKRKAEYKNAANFQKAYLVRNTCITPADQKSSYYEFIDYIKCDNDLIHLEYAFNAFNSADEEWSLIINIENDFDKPGSFEINEKTKFYSYYAYQDWLKIRFDKAKGTIVLKPKGEMYRLSGDMVVKGKPMNSTYEDHEEINGSLSGNAVLTEINFDQFISLIDN